MEIELGRCFWMFPQTQSQCVAMLGLESGALSRLLWGHTLVVQFPLKDVTGKMFLSPL